MRPEEAIDALNVWASATQQQAGMSPQDVVGMLAGVLSGNSDGVAQQVGFVHGLLLSAPATQS